MPPTHTDTFTEVLSLVAADARASSRFGEVTLLPDAITCAALASSDPAFYRVTRDNAHIWISLVTAARYLSQSIEQDLVHTGDKMAELLHEELIDVEYPQPRELPVEHFRDEHKLFTFRTAVPREDLVGAPVDQARIVWLVLQAFEACFARLGGMSAADGDE